ncbi:MAG TPA: GAF domain-containing protein [Streptosporangiaceae bacterium]|nr:GAF domain-containing protein [Streptosporangiaceae bacterium]
MPASNGPMSGSADGRTDVTERSLLQAIVEVARSVFGAAAASVFLLDEQTGELVFEAVAGEGEDDLVGTRFPSGTGLAGWVVMSGQALLVDDVARNPQFARDAAESTGYVPRSIMAAPLIRNGDCIGVLEVLDRGSRPRGDLSDVDLIGMLATEVALGLELVLRLRRLTGGQQPSTADAGGDEGMLRRIAARLPAATEPVASTVSRLLATADDLLAGESAASRGGSR